MACRKIELFFSLVYDPFDRTAKRKQNERGSPDTKISRGISKSSV